MRTTPLSKTSELSEKQASSLPLPPPCFVSSCGGVHFDSLKKEKRGNGEMWIMFSLPFFYGKRVWRKVRQPIPVPHFFLPPQMFGRFPIICCRSHQEGGGGNIPERYGWRKRKRRASQQTQRKSPDEELGGKKKLLWENRDELSLGKGEDKFLCLFGGQSSIGPRPENLIFDFRKKMDLEKKGKVTITQEDPF